MSFLSDVSVQQRLVDALNANAAFVTQATAFDGAGYQSQAYTLLNFGAGFLLPLGQRGVHLDLSLKNALNQRYADFLSRIKTNALDPGQGRNFVARVTWDY